MIDVTTLQIESTADGETKVSCWVKCRSTDDLDAAVAWLGLAHNVMTNWKAFCADRQNVTPIRRKEP